MTDMIKLFLAELLGTFFFLSVIIVTINNTKKDYFKGDSWIKVGLALAIAICLVGNISGANLNPAISIMLYLNDQLSLENLGIYVVAQILGAVLALAFFKYYKPELSDTV